MNQPTLLEDPAQHVLTVCSPTSPIVDLVRTCQRIAASDATVLLTGETGTGKEVFTRLIHSKSPRAQRALVAVNCGAIPEALLESELFGHVRGAFTGATQGRRGRLAAAHGGTLFLDEIGDLPLSLQVKLLRVLQERCYEPVGSTEPIPADFRLVAATNRDLSAEVAAGHFRRDLYYRLLVCPVEVPPLRQRRTDISRLFLHFWAVKGERRPIDPLVLDALEAYEWPGNVRELENLVERLSVCSDGEVIGLHDLPPSIRGDAPGTHLTLLPPMPVVRAATPTPAPIAHASTPVPCTSGRATTGDAVAHEPSQPSWMAPPSDGADCDRAPTGDEQGVHAEPSVSEGHPVDLPRVLRDLEDSYIDAALTRTQGNRKAAADLLGLHRTTLVEKLRRRQRGASGC